MKRGVSGVNIIVRLGAMVRLKPRYPFFRKHRRRRNTVGCVAYTLIILLVIHLPHVALAQDGRGYLEVSGGYKTGDFGTATRSNLYYVAPVLGYVSSTYDLSVTAPYLFLDSDSDGQAGMMNMDGGIGDIILRAGRVIVPEGAFGFSMDGALSLKLPTADEAKGLGTGETDYGAFLSLHQRFDKFKLSLMSGFVKTGDPSSADYNDIFLYGIGISKMFGKTGIYSSFEGRNALISEARNPQEINLGFFHVLNADYAIKGSTFVGLNDGGPDFGFNFGIIRWF